MKTTIGGIAAFCASFLASCGAAELGIPIIIGMPLVVVLMLTVVFAAKKTK